LFHRNPRRVGNRKGEGSSPGQYVTENAEGPQIRPHHRRPESPPNNRNHSMVCCGRPPVFVRQSSRRLLNGNRAVELDARFCYLIGMNTSSIIAALDEEIARLQNARSLIAGSASPKRRGRPPQSKPAGTAASKRRTLSPEARKKIAEAQRKRWAKQKKVTVTRIPAKHAPVKRPRVGKAIKTASSGKVPTKPVAAPAPKAD
jgi:hypothetical protein